MLNCFKVFSFFAAKASFFVIVVSLCVCISDASVRCLFFRADHDGVDIQTVDCCLYECSGIVLCFAIVLPALQERHYLAVVVAATRRYVFRADHDGADVNSFETDTQVIQSVDSVTMLREDAKSWCLRLHISVGWIKFSRRE